MRSLNAPDYSVLPNSAYPYMGSNRAGYLGATGNPNPWLLKVAPDTALWQNNVERYNQDPRYGIVATVGMGGCAYRCSHHGNLRGPYRGVTVPYR